MLAASTLERVGVRGEVFVTERAGHARELAAAAVARGAALVMAWGGDGTVNEVASALAFRDCPLAIVPSGSGNGLARDLGVPLEPSAAIAAAVDGSERIIDAGELDGHLFFNVAGIGFDARVAHQFAETGLVRRGLWRYVEITLRELFSFEGGDHTIVADGTIVRSRAFLIAFANARQYGHGALIAPHARLDDGKLDVVVIGYRSPLAVLMQAPRLFTGNVNRVPDVTTLQAAEIGISSAGRVLYHVDGEPFVGSAELSVRVRRNALRVRVPAL
jgi:diacylglycerol kinase (ATP)